MKINVIKKLRPGDEVTGNILSKMNVYKEKSCVFGVMSRIESFYFVETKTNRYTPAIGDIIIGKIFYKCADYYKLDLKQWIGVLPSLAFKNATKRFKPELEINDYVLAKITNIGTECLLTCIDEGLGKLEGYTIDIQHWKAKKLNMCSFIKEIGKLYKFKCALGLNGRVWISSDNLCSIRDVVYHLKKFS